MFRFLILMFWFFELNGSKLKLIQLGRSIYFALQIIVITLIKTPIQDEMTLVKTHLMLSLLLLEVICRSNRTRIRNLCGAFKAISKQAL